MTITAEIDQEEMRLILNFYFEAVTGRSIAEHIEFDVNSGKYSASVKMGEPIELTDPVHLALQQCFRRKAPKSPFVPEK